MSESAHPFAFLLPSVQNYAWGYKGNESLVGRIWEKSQQVTPHISNPQKVKEGTPYAELWYGIHPNGINLIVAPDSDSPQPISEFVKANPEFRGNNESLPFLLKVLCNDIALSIQCHPDKQTAERLFKEQPQVYKDSNHKPEISLALSDNVEALCGFREWVEIAAMISTLPELADLLGEEWMKERESDLKTSNLTPDQISICLKAAFLGFMKPDEQRLTACLASLLNNADRYLNSDNISLIVKTPLRIFVRLCSQFPNDAGCLAPFLLNHVVTKQGECLFTKANVLHAYLEGQIIECMACSDNVVRGGLTPKFKDIDLLTEILDFSPYGAPLVIPKQCGRFKHYRPPVDDFSLYWIQLPVGEDIESFELEGGSAAILTVLQGKAEITVKGATTGPLVQGHSIFLPAKSEISIKHCVRGNASSSTSIDFTNIMNGKEDGDFIAVVAVGGEARLK